MNLRLLALAKSRQPILVGPWTSELGFECLYWLPFLDHLKDHYKIAPERLIAVTRGGAGTWYGLPKTVELYDYVPASDLRIAALFAQRDQASIKQFRITGWERKLLALLAERMGLRRYLVLHPSLLYRWLEPWWKTQTMGFAEAMKSLRFTQMQAPPPPVGMALPEKFVAVRWYQRPTWPIREDLVDWTQALVRQLAQTVPVVILRSSVYADDHVDFPAPDGDHITIIHAEPWRDNLAVQSAVIKRAAAFIGTWGGVAQLAVRLGIPTAAFFDKWHSCSYQHRVLTEWLGMQTGVPVFVGRPQDLEFVRGVLPGPIALPAPARASSS